MATSLPDYYGLFGVEREADQDVIKKVYRKLVLQWHPDKHPQNREVAEEKIREINDAYETLSNPFKRSQYDNMLVALERKAKGFRLDTTMIKPRMSIPKEFMLSPLGHPDKFVRVVGMSLFVQSRGDAKAEFYDFFKEAKFSLWWLPEVNNMCRIRPQATAGVGQDGGLNFNFALSRQISVSEVILSPGQMAESAHFIAVASDVFKGAFRFECYAYPGHYLAFFPPTHLRVVGGTVEEKTAIDFMLVDYAKMFQYITVEEVLTPAVTKLGGQHQSVSLDDLRQDKNVRLYFENVQKKPIWADEDFELFFGTRANEWHYDARRAEVRLRSKHEQMAQLLRRAKSVAEVGAAISASYELDIERLPLETIEAVLKSLSLPSHPKADVTTQINHLDAQKKILIALPNVCEKKNMSFKRTLELINSLNCFGGEHPELKVLDWRHRCQKELGDIVSEMIRDGKAEDALTFRILAELCEMTLDWRTCGEKLTKEASRLCEGKSLELLLPLLKSSVKMSYGSLADLVATKAETFISAGSGESVSQLLEAMVSGGIQLDIVPSRLLKVFPKAPFETCASILAGLGEKGIQGEEMKACAKLLVAKKEELEALSPLVLLRLTVAATKSQDVAVEALDAVASAAAMVLNAFNMEDASKLLLAVAKAKSSAGGSGVQELYERAAEVIPPKLSELSSGQLIKVVLAVTKVEACRPLLETAAQSATARVADIQPSQMMLLMQGLLPLGGEHPSLQKMADNWAASFYEATRLEGLLGPDQIELRRKDLEAKGQLSADQLSKLALMVAPVMPNHPSFWNALGKRLREIFEDLSAVGVANLKSAFPDGAGPDFEKKEKILKKAYKEGGGKDKKDGDKEKEKDKDRERSRDRDRRRDRSRDRDRDRDRSRDRDRDRDKDRDRDRDREKDRDRGRDREKERDRDGAGNDLRLPPRTEEEIERQKRQKEELRRADRERVLELEREREREREKELERRREARKQMEREKEERKKEKKAKKKEKKKKAEGISSSSSDGGVQLTGLVGGAPKAEAAAVSAAVDLEVDGEVEGKNKMLEVDLDIDGTIELDDDRPKAVAKAAPGVPAKPNKESTGAIELDGLEVKAPEPVQEPKVSEKEVETVAATPRAPKPAQNGHVEDIDLQVDLCQVQEDSAASQSKAAEKRKADSAVVDLDDAPTAKQRREARKARAAEKVAPTAASPVVCDLDLDGGGASIDID